MGYKFLTQSPIQKIAHQEDPPRCHPPYHIYPPMPLAAVVRSLDICGTSWRKLLSAPGPIEHYTFKHGGSNTSWKEQNEYYQEAYPRSA
jgi:hypothetical protein